MNRIKLLVTTALLAVGVNASAQFTNSKSSSSAVSPNGWNTIWVQYNPTNFDTDISGLSAICGDNLTAFSVGYSHAFSMSKSTPIYIEAGLGLQYTYGSENIGSDYDDDAYSTKTSLFSAKVPVNIMYNWQINNSNIAITPYVGLTFRCNIVGKLKEHYLFVSDEDEDFNLFDEDDMGGYSWKRFQIGWQIGVNARFNNQFLIGVSYGTDFSEICKSTKLKTTSITLGYCF